MYKTISELAKALTDAQLEILMLLYSGYELVTNEGVNYRCWLEIERQKTAYLVQKATGNKLLSEGLMVTADETIPSLFRFKISKKGKDVLEQIALRKPTRLTTTSRSIQRKGIDGVDYN